MAISRGLRIGIALGALGLLAPGPSKPIPDLNRAVLDFAQASIGKAVGDGQCTSLAVAALRNAGARLPVFNGDRDADYEWGKLVATLTPGDHPTADILPGDVLQFRAVRIVTVRKSGRSIHTRTLIFPHHTAIVAAVSGSVVKVLHQNFGKDDRQRLVASESLRLDDIKAGTVWVYRPVAE